MKTNLKVVAYCGIALLVISFLYGMFQTSIFEEETLVAEVISNLVFIALTILSLVIYCGYLTLSKKHNARFLEVMTWIGIAFNVIFLILMLIGTLLVGIPQASADELPDLSQIPTLDDLPDYQSQEQMITEEQAMQFLASLIIFYVLFSVILGTYYVLFGFSLLKLKKKVPYSKPTAILYIVSGFTFIIFIGFFISIAAKILEIIMFFKASKSIEHKQKKTVKKKKK